MFAANLIILLINPAHLQKTKLVLNTHVIWLIELMSETTSILEERNVTKGAFVH